MDSLDKVKVGDLRTISLIAEGLSLHGASIIKGLSRDQARRSVKRLEEAVGARLYERADRPIGKRARLTPEGYALAEYADKVIELMEAVSRQSKP